MAIDPLQRAGGGCNDVGLPRAWLHGAYQGYGGRMDSLTSVLLFPEPLKVIMALGFVLGAFLLVVLGPR